MGPESALSQLTNALEALIFLGFNGNRWEIIPAQARAQDLLNLEAQAKEIAQQRALQEAQALEIQNLKEAMNLLLNKEKE